MRKNNGEVVRIDPIMKFYIDSETKKLAAQIKKQTGLKTITIPFINGSQWVGDKLLNNKAMIKYRVKKVGLNEGVVEFL